MSVYVTQSPDTDPQAEAVFFECLGKMKPWKKMERIGELTDFTRLLAKRQAKKLNPNWSEDELRYHLVCLCYGETLAKKAFYP